MTNEQVLLARENFVQADLEYIACSSGFYKSRRDAAWSEFCAAVDGVLADRARQAPAPVEVSRLAEDALNSLIVTNSRDDHYYRKTMRTLRTLIDRLASMASTPVGEVPAKSMRKQMQALGYSDTAINAMGDSTTMMQRAIESTTLLRKAQNDRDEAEWIDSLQPGERGRATSPAPAASKGAESVFGECSFCKSAIRGVHTQACRDRAASAEPEAQKATPSGELSDTARLSLLNKLARHRGFENATKALASLPLAAEAQKAVARIVTSIYGDAEVQWAIKPRELPPGTKLYAHPAASMEVQGLSESEVIAATADLDCDRPGWAIRWADVVTRALAAKNGWRLGEGQ